MICNGGDINQVFINLIVNAAHAIEDHVDGSGERGTITHQHPPGGRLRARHHRRTRAAASRPRSPERIFDPFFTTKEVGRGTGQGLAIARTMVVERHGGTLTFETVPGRGTTFHIRLPVAGLAPVDEPALAAV